MIADAPVRLEPGILGRADGQDHSSLRTTDLRLRWLSRTCWPSRLLRNTFDSPLSIGCGTKRMTSKCELRQRAAHLVEPVLGLGDDLVEAVVERPDLLLFGQRAEVPLAAPVAPRAADPLIQHPAPVELDDVLELRDEVGELRIGLGRSQLVRHLERHRDDRARIVGQRRLRHQDLVIAVCRAAA